MSRRFTLPVEVDDFGDMSITFPAELMTELGWYEGTEIEYTEEPVSYTHLRAHET